MFFPPLFYIKSFLSKAKKVVIVCITLYIVFQLFMFFWNKNTGVVVPDRTARLQSQVDKVIHDPQLNKSEEGKLYISLYKLYTCSLTGQACSENKPATQEDIQNSLTGQLSNMLTFPLRHPPASGVEWAYTGLQSVGFIPQSYAAEGIGYAALAPFRPVWLVFRNLIFLLMVLIIVIIGFMVMFRAKINPQTVITVESALPKIAITLVIITFSYAIAGFLIDIMYISMGLLIGLFNSGTHIGFNPSEILNNALYGSSGGLIGTLFNNKIDGLAVAMYDIIPQEIVGIVNSIVGTYLINFALLGLGKLSFWQKLLHANSAGEASGIKGIISALKGSQFLSHFSSNVGKGGMPIISLIGMLVVVVLGGTAFLNLLAPWLTQAVIWIILMLSLLFIFFRLFFLFISVYVQILLLIIFSPVILAFEVIPGRAAFSGWIKSLLLHLSTFPIFLVLILTAQTIINQPSGITLWKPPYTYGFEGDAFNTIIALALVYMAPEFIKMFKEMTGVKPMASNLNLGAFFGGATAAIGGGIGMATTFHSLKSTFLGTELLDAQGNPKFVGGLLPKGMRERIPFIQGSHGEKDQGTTGGGQG